MKYRSKTDTPIRITTTLGHVFLVGREWVELPAVCHAQAVAAGCDVDTGTSVTSIADAEAPKASAEAVSNRDHADLIREAIELMMARDEEDDFTQAGDPNLKVLSRLAGINVTRDAMLAVWTPIKAKLQAEAGEA